MAPRVAEVQKQTTLTEFPATNLPYAAPLPSTLRLGLGLVGKTNSVGLGGCAVIGLGVDVPCHWAPGAPQLPASIGQVTVALAWSPALHSRGRCVPPVWPVFLCALPSFYSNQASAQGFPEPPRWEVRLQLVQIWLVETLVDPLGGGVC